MPWAKTFAFRAQKTMYGGKHIAKGDTIFVFASENEGGPGLIASGIVTSAKAIAKKPGIARQTPRVSITIRRTALARRRLGRSELKLFSDWNDGRPETELNFKFYRQATNKIVGHLGRSGGVPSQILLTRQISASTRYGLAKRSSEPQSFREQARCYVSVWQLSA